MFRLFYMRHAPVRARTARAHALDFYVVMLSMIILQTKLTILATCVTSMMCSQGRPGGKESLIYPPFQVSKNVSLPIYVGKA